MATLASDIFNKSRAVLNDLPIDLFTDTTLLPFLQIANDDLSDAMVDNGATVQKEVLTDIPLAANSNALPLPNDIIVPIQLFEKNVGEPNEAYRQIDQRDFLPNKASGGSELSVYSWREGAINLVPSNQAKLIRIRYYRLITSIVGPNTIIELPHALGYLAYHTAAMAAEHIGQNRQKAIDLESLATAKLNKLLKREVKQNARPVRRRAFRLTRPVTYQTR
jgi:hypothetical protein